MPITEDEPGPRHVTEGAVSAPVGGNRTDREKHRDGTGASDRELPTVSNQIHLCRGAMF